MLLDLIFHWPTVFGAHIRGKSALASTAERSESDDSESLVCRHYITHLSTKWEHKNGTWPGVI